MKHLAFRANSYISTEGIIILANPYHSFVEKFKIKIQCALKFSLNAIFYSKVSGGNDSAHRQAR